MPFHFTCEQCGKAFTRGNRRNHGKPIRFCSNACYRAIRLPIPQPDGTLLIPLTKGQFAIIDAADLPLVAGYNWHACRKGSTWYAQRPDTTTLPGRYLHVKMHHAIRGTSAMTDHVDRNGLNNRRSNLRPASSSQNVANTKMRHDNTSGFRGVVWDRRKQKWEARLHVQKRKRFLGYFADVRDAARAYDTAALEAFGEFASLNFPD
jgi:hypothetical protein